ncbi:MAG TPA: lytic transglycosylase domain-containing protein [Amaricoccus sp.]|nr:lytic transglycosylase domain-containing protein [Amaricoccus sp.]
MSRRFGLWPVAALALAFALAAAGARAEPAAAITAEQGAQICERAIVAGARRAGLPEEVLHAISLTETGRVQGGRLRPYPWAINREGKGFWFGSREEALAFARASLAAGRRSFDVGCFQINYHWHGANFASLEAMFDPDTGADYAARFLKSLHAERGNWSAAAGAYHSQTPARANVYRARFDRIIAGLGGAPLVVAAAAEPEAAPEPAAPRKSRTRLARGPKIITVAPREPAPTPAPVSPAPNPAAELMADLTWAGQ